MATVTELRSRLKVRLSRRTGGATLDTEVDDALTHVQREVLERSPVLPNYLRARADFTVSGAHDSINTATQSELARFLRLDHQDTGRAVTFLNVTSGRYEKVPRFDDLEQLEQKYPGTSDVPKGYFFDGVNIWLYPSLTGDVGYRVWFKRYAEFTPSVPDGNDQTLWTINDGDLLLHTAGVEVAQYLRDTAAQQYFAAKRQEAHGRFIRRLQAELDADQEYVMGD